MFPAPLIDTHTHLADPVFDPDRDQVIRRAERAGVDQIIAVAETMADARRNLELAARHRHLHPAAGLYPSQLEEIDADAMIAFIRDHRQRLVAIGEVGLDFWLIKDVPGKERQRALFARFIDLSLELDLPLNVHSRSAGRHAVAMLLERGARRVQLHAFDGKAAAALPAVEAGFFFSIPPSIIRSRQKQKLVERLPLDCLLVETDSPVLGPDPERRNEPANAALSIKTIARLKDVPENTVREVVRDNTLRLYGDRLTNNSGEKKR